MMLDWFISPSASGIANFFAIVAAVAWAINLCAPILKFNLSKISEYHAKKYIYKLQQEKLQLILMRKSPNIAVFELVKNCTVCLFSIGFAVLSICIFIILNNAQTESATFLKQISIVLTLVLCGFWIVIFIHDLFELTQKLKKYGNVDSAVERIDGRIERLERSYA